MFVAGIDYSTHAVDVVLVHLDDLESPRWIRFPVEGPDAFDRARRVWIQPGSMWDDVAAIGIEDPRGQNSGALYRVQGAILAQLPTATLVHPWIPSAWRKKVGLPGNASKLSVSAHVPLRAWNVGWPQDAIDAYCIALATRQAITVTA